MSREPEYHRNPKQVQAVLRHWQAAEEFVTHYPSDHPLRQQYEQILTQLAPAFERAKTLPELIAEYEAQPKASHERAQQIAQACTKFGTEDRPLLPHMVEHAAYYRRSRALLATWWTHDWPNPESAATNASITPSTPEALPPDTE